MIGNVRHVRNVVLTGFMGTGKSTVGRLLAERLGYEFVDTDQLIVERYGPIPEIFATDGEAAFRAYEREVAGELAERQGLVIATGGRLLLDRTNADALGVHGEVFCLTATIDTILARVTGDGVDERPLLAGDDVEQRITMLLESRAEAYARFTQVATDAKAPDDIVAEIVRRR